MRETIMVAGALAVCGAGLEAQQRPTVGPKVRIAVMEATWDDGVVQRAFMAGGNSPSVYLEERQTFARGLTEMMISELLKSGRFIVVERKALDDVMAEQNLQATAANPETATQAGRLVAAQFLIRPEITEFSYGDQAKTQGGAVRSPVNIPLVGRPRVGGGRAKISASLVLDSRIIEVETAQIITSVKSEATAEQSMNNFDLGTAVFDYNNTDFEKTPLGAATRQAVAQAAAIKLNAYVVPILGDKRVSELTPSDFDEWLTTALKRQQRRKPKKPRPEPKRRRKAKPAPTEANESGRASPADPDEQRRRRKSTLNRVITALKAALNHAHDRQKVASRDAWAKLKKFKGVDAARLRWLTEAEAKRLMNAANADMRKLMQGGLMTGCRPGELARARARDFDSTSETLLVPDSKTGKPRRVPLTAEGVGLLESWTAGMQPDDLIFTRADGSPWHRVAVIRGMQIASDAAKISPRANFYSLRHTYASHLVQQGTPLLFVASALGHRDARMVEKHYGHFAPSHVAQTIRAKLPTFGIKPDRKVRTLKPR